MKYNCYFNYKIGEIHFLMLKNLKNELFFKIILIVLHRKQKHLLMTKIAQILLNRGLSQTDLYNLIEQSDFKTIGLDRINKLVNGKQDNYNVYTAKTIKTVLGVSYNDIIED
jgi:hypothetical protein